MHAAARSEGRGSLPVAATATLGMLLNNLPDPTCQIVSSKAHASRQARAEFSYHISSPMLPLGSRACSEHGQPSQHGGLIPLLRLLFLRLVPPRFLLTSQTIICLAFGEGRDNRQHTRTPGQACVTHRQTRAHTMVKKQPRSDMPALPSAPFASRPLWFAQLAHQRWSQHPRAAAQRHIRRPAATVSDASSTVFGRDY